MAGGVHAEGDYLVLQRSGDLRVDIALGVDVAPLEEWEAPLVALVVDFDDEAGTVDIDGNRLAIVDPVDKFEGCVAVRLVEQASEGVAREVELNGFSNVATHTHGRVTKSRLTNKRRMYRLKMMTCRNITGASIEQAYTKAYPGASSQAGN